MPIVASSKWSWLTLALIALPLPAAADPADPYIWLEDPTAPATTAWVTAHDAKTLGELTADARYQPLHDDLLQVGQAEDKLPEVTLLGGDVYEFWQDATHTHGVWRRQPLASFGQPGSDWETVVDLDALAQADGVDWVWQEADCLGPAYARCLIQISNGGKDAVVVRELDLKSKTFVQDGFVLPEAKTTVAWLDQDTVMLGTDFGPDSETSSGYPREVRLWHRGTSWQSAVPTFAGSKDDVDVAGQMYADPTGRIVLLVRDTDYFHAKRFVLAADGSQAALAIPDDADIEGYSRGQLVLLLNSDWTVSGATLAAGSVVAYDPVAGGAKPLYQPTITSAVDSVAVVRDHVVVNALENVTSTLYSYSLGAPGGAPAPVRLPLPGRGTATLAGADPFADPLLVTFESFLTAPSLLRLGPGTAAPGQTLMSEAARFDARDLAYEQQWAVSRDGTKIPYFIVHRRDLPLDGQNPTLLYGYGGFAIAETPRYSAGIGREWLGKGGVYVLANIRGGGEFGPAWHTAAILQNRQKAFDDFIAVATDLIARGVTTPRRLGIQGTSNGGLLVGAVMVQRPDLFHAVVCGMPLLDMLRYTQIAAGASWIGEYGDPADPTMHAVLARYSPYQNLSQGATYPKIFLFTSTDDDRVGPGHARKLAARMEEYGAPFYFFENTEGGHDAADAEQTAQQQALQYTYLYEQLVD